MRDRNTGRCRGFGYVTYSTTDEAHAAVNDLNTQQLDGRRIRVDFASNRVGHGEKTPGSF
jgi:cold-inducible RNA-binding protein